MLRNAGVKFLSQPVHVRVERTDTPVTAGIPAGRVLTMPIAHGEGNFYAEPEEIARLEGEARSCSATPRRTAGSIPPPT
jgi:phosphoribosylformylglycinamidine synthase